MYFITPVNLLLLLLIPALIAFIVWRERIRQHIIRLMGDGDLVHHLFPRMIFTRRIWKSALWLVTLSALLIALARPVWGADISVVETQGVSIMFVLDVSNSMNAQDILPSRLERAKLSLQEMFQGLTGNEMGLILFAGSAFVQFPLTTDTASAQTFLNAASSGSISQQGTDIAAALNLAMDSFDESVTAKRIIVLMTDGENLEGDLDPIISNAAQQEVTIDTVGYGGAEGAPIPILDHNGQITGYKADASGNLVLSTLDEATLQMIAQRTGGIYQRAASDGQEAKRLIDVINQSEPSALDRTVQTHDVERFEIFVALAVLALTLEILLPETNRKAA